MQCRTKSEPSKLPKVSSLSRFLLRFDLEYPVECDEEYWETSDPEKAFQQPPGKPCKMSCFIWLIKLAEMLGYAHRTLYATKKSKMLIGLIGNEWESRVVSELDSSMNKWKDDLPDFRETFAAFESLLQVLNSVFSALEPRKSGPCLLLPIRCPLYFILSSPDTGTQTLLDETIGPITFIICNVYKCCPVDCSCT